jgi:tRNA uridine 5-carboxymethylaminomethyl modification enzyme
MQDQLDNTTNLEIIEEAVVDFVINDNVCNGVVLANGNIIKSKKVIITAGTYLNSRILIGANQVAEGPDGQKTTVGISKKLHEYDFGVQRLKTGTPPRVTRDSINYDETRLEPGMAGHLAFSYGTDREISLEEQEPCWLIYTNKETHDIIHENLELSSMYGAIDDIESKGPRYCPSIDDKVHRFSEKDRHQLFLEPESRLLDTIYIQGFSSSMPIDVQEKMIRSLPGLKDCKITKYAYAIEYDAIDARKLKPTLESKEVANLYFAGQVNGTSGYEEADEELVLRRDESYIGVLIDDLVTKGTDEPYRLLTSRAEHRLLLRHDNADIRLKDYAVKYKTISNEEIEIYKEKKIKIDELINILKESRFTPKSEINNELDVKLTGGTSAYELLKRPSVKIDLICKSIGLDYH